jgi:hypothetical protein
MTDADDRHRLAVVVVDGLELGAGKGEWNVTAELFATFKLDLKKLQTDVHKSLGKAASVEKRRVALREAAAQALAASVSDATTLVNELVRRGGQLVALVENVYRFLAGHTATTDAASETFQVRRDDLDVDLTISEAFVEELRRVVRAPAAVEIGQIDEAMVRDFLRWDNGFYGSWPVGATHGVRLADGLLHLAWLVPAVREHPVVGVRSLLPSVERAAQAAERLVAGAQRVVDAYIAHLTQLVDVDPVGVASRVYVHGKRGIFPDDLADELRRFRVEGVLGARTYSGFANLHSAPESITESDRPHEFVVGFNTSFEPVIRPLPPTEEFEQVTGLGALASFAAMWRLSVWDARAERALRTELGVVAEVPDNTLLADWIDRLTTACEEAAAWLAGDVFTPTGTVEIERCLEAVEQLLNLPLWRQRELLYEIWTLCATLGAAEQAGWTVELPALTASARILSFPSAAPVALMRLEGGTGPCIEVRHEPRRTRRSGAGKPLTPDIVVTTAAPWARDLLVVEAKDQHRMKSGYVEGRPADEPDRDSGLGVARRYASELGPVVTWICNHCDFDQPVDPTVNHGDPWSQVHLAAQFRPGTVPAAFADSVRTALAPPGPSFRTGG